MFMGTLGEIVIIFIAFSVVVTLIFNTLIPSNIEQRTYNKYQVDKDLFFSYLDEALQSADSVSVATDENTNGIEYKNTYSIITATNKYRTPEGEFLETYSFDDKSGVLSYIHTKSKITLSEVEEISTNSVVFDSIKHLYASDIEKVCTDVSLATGCYPVDNLIDITIYGDKTNDREVVENRSRRLMYYD